MNASFATRSRASLGALGLFAAACAQAAPYTLYFSGTTTYEYDYVTSTTTSGGTTFSGWLTFDIAVAEFTPPSSSSITQAYSESGCAYYVFGSCVSDYGTGTPVVTDYLFTLGSSSYSPLTASPISSFPLYDFSRRYNYDSGSGSEEWEAVRGQYQYGYSGDPNGAATYSWFRRTFQLYPTDGSSLLAQPYTTLDQGFDLTSVPAGQTNVYFTDSQFSFACTNGSGGCGSYTYTPGSLYLQGKLTSASFVEGPASVPEPAALSLLGLGALLLGIGGLRASPRREVER